MSDDAKPFLKVVREGDVPPAPAMPDPQAVVEIPPLAPVAAESENTRILRDHLAASDDSLPSAEKFAAAGTTLIGGAIELGRGKPAEAVKAWLGAHTTDVKHEHLGGTKHYSKMGDLKEAVLAAASELDEANAPNLSNALYVVVGLRAETRVETVRPTLPAAPSFWTRLCASYQFGTDVLGDGYP